MMPRACAIIKALEICMPGSSSVNRQRLAIDELTEGLAFHRFHHQEGPAAVLSPTS
jgi:hypothetical protein